MATHRVRNVVRVQGMGLVVYSVASCNTPLCILSPHYFNHASSGVRDTATFGA